MINGVDVQNSAAYTGSASSITVGNSGSGGTAKTGDSASNTTNNGVLVDKKAGITELSQGIKPVFDSNNAELSLKI